MQRGEYSEVADRWPSTPRRGVRTLFWILDCRRHRAGQRPVRRVGPSLCCGQRDDNTWEHEFVRWGATQWPPISWIAEAAPHIRKRCTEIFLYDGCEGATSDAIPTRGIDTSPTMIGRRSAMGIAVRLYEGKLQAVRQNHHTTSDANSAIIGNHPEATGVNMPRDAGLPAYMTVPQLARHTHLGEDRIRSLIASGKLIAANLNPSGRPHWKIRREDWEACWNSLTNAPTTRGPPLRRRTKPVTVIQFF